MFGSGLDHERNSPRHFHCRYNLRELFPTGGREDRGPIATNLFRLDSAAPVPCVLAKQDRGIRLVPTFWSGQYPEFMNSRGIVPSGAISKALPAGRRWQKTEDRGLSQLKFRFTYNRYDKEIYFLAIITSHIKIRSFCFRRKAAIARVFALSPRIDSRKHSSICPRAYG